MCKKKLPLDNFHFSSISHDKRASCCKDCKRKYMKIYQQVNKLEYNKRVKSVKTKNMMNILLEKELIGNT